MTEAAQTQALDAMKDIRLTFIMLQIHLL